MKQPVMAMALVSGKGYDQPVMIISGRPSTSHHRAIRYAAELIRGKVFDVAKKEFAAANKAGLKDILNARKAAAKPAAEEEEVKHRRKNR